LVSLLDTNHYAPNSRGRRRDTHLPRGPPDRYGQTGRIVVEDVYERE